MIVSFETARLAKTIGFKNPVNKFYYKHKNHWDQGDGDSEVACLNHNEYEHYYSAPDILEMHNWLQEAHNIRVFPTQKIAGDFGFELHVLSNKGKHGCPFERVSPFTKHYPTFDLALDEGIQFAINLIINESFG